MKTMVFGRCRFKHRLSRAPRVHRCKNYCISIAWSYRSAAAKNHRVFPCITNSWGYVGLILHPWEFHWIDISTSKSPWGSPGLHPLRGTRASGPKELRQTSWRNEMRSLMVNPSSASQLSKKIKKNDSGKICTLGMKKFFSSETR